MTEDKKSESNLYGYLTVGGAILNPNLSNFLQRRERYS
jgi:hypothetical protein